MDTNSSNFVTSNINDSPNTNDEGLRIRHPHERTASFPGHVHVRVW
jgi:hypothetical protein